MIIGTRGSELAVLHAEKVRERLKALGYTVQECERSDRFYLQKPELEGLNRGVDYERFDKLIKPRQFR